MTGRRWFSVILSLILIVGMSIPAGAQLLAFLQPTQVIVQILPTADINFILGVLGGTLLDSIPDANLYLLNVPLPLSSLTQSLLGILGIQWAEINTGVALPRLHVLGLVTVPGVVAPDWYKDQPSWQLIEAQSAVQYSYSNGGGGGSGVTIADINSQVRYHPALVGHLTQGYDFVAAKAYGSAGLNQSDASFLDQSDASFLDQSDASFLDQSDASFLDQFGAILGAPDLIPKPAYSHGTLCAGVLAAIAPGSWIMPLRAFDDNGQSDLFTLAKAIRWAVQHRAQVINMSFGTHQRSKALQSAVQYAQQNNVLLVASAGNNNTSDPQYPAAFSGVMTTASTDRSDHKASFSNYGSDIFLDAPGVHIISTYPGASYSIVSGTSFSAPAVAGTAALVRSLGTDDAAGALAGSAVDINSQNPNYLNQLGYGRIDVLRAVKPN